MTSTLIWHGAKIVLDNGKFVHIAFTYPSSIETLFNQWLGTTADKEEWSFIEYLNNLWKGKYMAVSMDQFEYMNTDPSLLKKDEWSPAYFEMSNGTNIDIMHNISGPKKGQLITGAVERWIMHTNDYSQNSFIDYFNKCSGFKAIPKALFNHLN